MSDNLDKGRLLVLATAISSGMAVYFNATQVKGADPIAFTTLKNLLTALMLLAMGMALASWGELAKLTRRQWMKLLAIAVIGGSVPFALFFWGLSMADAASGSFIYRLLFFFAAGLGIVFLKEKPSWRVAAGVLVLLLANALMLGSWKGFGLGEGLVLLATMMWAAEGMLSKKALQEISPQTVATVRMGGGSLLLLGFLLFTGKIGMVMAAPVLGWGAILSAAFLLVYVSTWYRGLALLPLGEATAILSAGGLVSAGMALLFGGQALTTAQALPLLMTAAGVALVLGAGPFLDAMQRMRSWLVPKPAPLKL